MSEGAPEAEAATAPPVDEPTRPSPGGHRTSGSAPGSDPARETRSGASGRIRRWLPVGVAAVVVRLSYWAFVTPRWRPDADADQYVLIARSLADGTGYSLVFPQLELHATAFRPPLYPLLLTPGAWLFGEALWPARLLNVGIGSLSAVLAGVLAARVGGRRAGLVAGLAVAAYPPLVANDTVTLTEPLALALMLGAILLIDDDRWVWAGIATGAMLLTRPNGYLVVGILAFWVWRKLGLRQAAGLVGCAVLVLAPWLVRNQIQVGTWRPTTSDGFTIAAIYNTPAQDAGTFIDPVFNPWYGDLDHRFAQFDEALWSQKLTDESIEALKADPGYVFHVIDRNISGYFELDPSLNRYPENNDGRRWGFRQAMLPVYYVVTVLGVVGLARAWRDVRVQVLAALVAQFVVLSLLLVAPPRLRAPFDLACCIGLGLLVGAFLDRRRGVDAAEDESSSPDEVVTAEA